MHEVAGRARIFWIVHKPAQIVSYWLFTSRTPRQRAIRFKNTKFRSSAEMYETAIENLLWECSHPLASWLDFKIPDNRSEFVCEHLKTSMIDFGTKVLLTSEYRRLKRVREQYDESKWRIIPGSTLGFVVLFKLRNLEPVGQQQQLNSLADQQKIAIHMLESDLNQEENDPIADSDNVKDGQFSLEQASVHKAIIIRSTKVIGRISPEKRVEGYYFTHFLDISYRSHDWHELRMDIDKRWNFNRKSKFSSKMKTLIRKCNFLPMFNLFIFDEIFDLIFEKMSIW